MYNFRLPTKFLDVRPSRGGLFRLKQYFIWAKPGPTGWMDSRLVAQGRTETPYPQLAPQAGQLVGYTASTPYRYIEDCARLSPAVDNGTAYSQTRHLPTPPAIKESSSLNANCTGASEFNFGFHPASSQNWTQSSSNVYSSHPQSHFGGSYGPQTFSDFQPGVQQSTAWHGGLPLETRTTTVSTVLKFRTFKLTKLKSTGEKIEETMITQWQDPVISTSAVCSQSTIPYSAPQSAAQNYERVTTKFAQSSTLHQSTIVNPLASQLFECTNNAPNSAVQPLIPTPAFHPTVSRLAQRPQRGPGTNSSAKPFGTFNFSGGFEPQPTPEQFAAAFQASQAQQVATHSGTMPALALQSGLPQDYQSNTLLNIPTKSSNIKSRSALEDLDPLFAKKHEESLRKLRDSSLPLNALKEQLARSP